MDGGSRGVITIRLQRSEQRWEYTHPRGIIHFLSKAPWRSMKQRKHNRALQYVCIRSAVSQWCMGLYDFEPHDNVIGSRNINVYCQGICALFRVTHETGKCYTIAQRVLHKAYAQTRSLYSKKGITASDVLTTVTIHIVLRHYWVQRHKCVPNGAICRHD
jgi:hypothetical protein